MNGIPESAGRMSTAPALAVAVVLVLAGCSEHIQTVRSAQTVEHARRGLGTCCSHQRNRIGGPK